MDSNQAAPRKARRLAAVSSFIAGALMMGFSIAHAATTCRIDAKVLRDGIVSLPLTPAPPTALDLVSLGTIHDPGRNTTHSIWRVFNSGTTSQRAFLQAPDGARIPFLARAGSEITLRSDSLDATADHELIAGNSTLDQAGIEVATFTDARELSGAECLFEGNVLYAGEHAGAVKVSTLHRAVVAEIPGTLDLSAIATGQPEGELWTLRGNSLRAFDVAGAEINNFTLPSTATAGSSGRPRLVVNHGSDDLWVAIGATLYRLDFDGQVLGSVTYGEEIREISLAPASRLWVVLESDVHVMRHGAVANEAIREAAHLVLPADVSTLAYDSYWDQMWLVAGNELSKYDVNGTLIETLTLTVPQPIQQLAADGTGAMWATGENRLFRVQADGSVVSDVAAFASGASIVDLASDPADGAAWLTSGSRIKNFDRDGILVLDLLPPPPPGGGVRQFRFLELFADRTAPAVQFLSPASGATVSTPRPTLELEYYDPPGYGVADETLELLVGEDPLPVDCDTTPTHAVCVPAVDLPQGEITVFARVYDHAGNLSPARQRTFTVQTATGPQPQVYLNSPYDGMLTRNAYVSVLGWVVDATSLTLNGEPVALDSANWFALTYQLTEGPNLLRLIAVGAGGATGQLDVNVVLDTTAPAAPNLALIQASIDEQSGQLRLTAPAGTFEPNARLRVFNETWEYWTTVVANQDGSLSALVVAEPGHALSITVGDEAGNERAQVELPYSIEQLSLTITSPGSPVTVATRDLVIQGAFTGPADSSVTANGVVAAMTGNSGGRQFVVRVRLAAGQNSVQVIAAAPGQASVTREIAATRSGGEPFRIDASATEGPAPLQVEFTVQRFDTTRIRRVEADFDGDGVFDTVSEGSRVGDLTHEYLVPGSYVATFRIRTTTDVLFTYEVPVLVQTAEDQNPGIRAVWQRFRDALAAGNTTAALDCMMPELAERYSSALTALQSSLPQIATSFSDIYPTGAPGLAEYVLTREVNGQPTAFLVYFQRGSDGVWRLANM